MALDISIVDADENEIEPEAPVSIEMKIDSLPGVKDLDDVADSIEIQHHVENNGETDVELVAQNGDELNIERNTIKSKFDVESFSTFTITWNNNRNTTTVHHGYFIMEDLRDFQVSFLVCVPALYEMMYKGLLKNLEKAGKLEAVMALAEAHKNDTMKQKAEIFKEIHAAFGGHVKIFISGAAALDNGY